MANPKYKKAPLVVIKRLTKYYRYLGDLSNTGIERVSSSYLSEKMGCTASQIRQDLNFFGGFGQQGYGYHVKQLSNAIGDILGLDRKYSVIILGAGYLGHALAKYSNFSKRGFVFTGIFDINPDLIGTKVGDLTVMHTDDLIDFCKSKKPDIAVFALPKTASPELAEQLVNLGIKGFWNFSHMDIQTSKNVPVENVHLSESLMTLAYRINNEEDEQ